MRHWKQWQVRRTIVVILGIVLAFRVFKEPGTLPVTRHELLLTVIFLLIYMDDKIQALRRDIFGTYDD